MRDLPGTTPEPAAVDAAAREVPQAPRETTAATRRGTSAT